MVENDVSSNGDKKRADVQRKVETAYLERWKIFLNRIQKPLRTLLVSISRLSAKNPYKTVVFVIILSFAMIVAGFLTNFFLETDNNILWSPTGSQTSIVNEWVKNPEESGFPQSPRRILAIIHSGGKDVLHMDGMSRVFDVIDMIRDFEGYDEMCNFDEAAFDYAKCDISSSSGFWENHNRSLYEQNIQSDDELKDILSQFRFANGNLANRDLIIGNGDPALVFNDLQTYLTIEGAKAILNDIDIFDEEYQDEILKKAAESFRLDSAKGFMIMFEIPNYGAGVDFELLVVQELLKLNDKWIENDDGYFLSLTTKSSNSEEITRSIVENIPLLIGAFLIMTLFTTYSLSKCHRIKNQVSVGMGAVFSIFLALLTGYGLMFCIGIPLTSLTYLFPYAMLGLGLDNTFIITGCFLRMDPNKDAVERIEDTIHEIGMSIAVSTLTTVVAYILGSTSAMPGIRWFCLYAAPVILISFLYQLTFLVALIVLDDERQKANRLDFLFCYTSSKHDADVSTQDSNTKSTCSGKMVDAYAKYLLKPFTKILVVIVFAAMLIVGSIYASGIRSELDPRDLLPMDSYVLQYINDLDDYGGGSAVNFQFAWVYFRDVDVSDPSVRDQMNDYVNDLVKLDSISSPPLSFWLRDFKFWSEIAEDVQDLDFNSQMDLFLEIPQFRDLHAEDIVRNENGDITVSRTLLGYDQVDPYNVREQIDAFRHERNVTANQIINNGSTNAHFFTNSLVYFFWELWIKLPKEVLFTISFSLMAIAIISLIFVPHPIGALLLTPIVAATFIEVVAVLRLAGLYMNALTAIGLITCVGLVVDYSIHICLAYFEIEDAQDRDDRVHKVVTTMGVSILKGGFTTFLGVLLLSLNTSLGFRTIFVTFIGITTLGVSHGLILLPVLLSYFGPMEKVEKEQLASDKEIENDLHFDETYANSDNGMVPKEKVTDRDPPPNGH